MSMAKRPTSEKDKMAARIVGAAEAGVGKADHAMKRGIDEAAGQARAASEGFGAVLQSGAILAGVAQTASQEWLSYAQGATLRNIQAVSALTRCRSMGELMAAQSDRFAEEVGELVQSSRRISERMLDAAQDAAGAMGGRGV
jgi:hypothetical protein